MFYIENDSNSGNEYQKTTPKPLLENKEGSLAVAKTPASPIG
jgi:hypothetical protein